MSLVMSHATGSSYEYTFASASEGNWTATASFLGLSSGPRTFAIDRTSPSFSVQLETMPTRSANWPSPSSWRRDERPHVLLTASEAVQVASFSFAGTPLPTLGLSECSNVGLVCSVVSARCSCGRLDFAGPPLLALSGTFDLVASATDLAGNSKTQTLASLPVTRMRWEASPAHGAPALDSNGNIFVPTNGEGIVSWTPAGVRRSFTVDAGTSALAIDNANNRLYFGQTVVTGGNIRALLRAVSLTTGADLSSIDITNVSGNIDTTVSPSLISHDTTAASIRAVDVAYSDTGQTFVIAWAPGSSMAPMLQVSGVGRPRLPTIVVGQNVYFLADGTIFQRVFNGLTWGGSASYNVPNIYGIATSNGISIGAVTTTSPGVWLNGRVASPGLNSVGLPVFSDSSTMLVAADSSLKRIPVTTAASLSVTNIATFNPPQNAWGAPIIGEPPQGLNTDSIYAVSDAARLWVVENGQAWSAPLSASAPAASISPALDCNRLQSEVGRPGVLYAVAESSGTIWAVLVDSPKLSTTSVWPKYQRDAANSGNANSALFPLNPGCP